MPRFTVTVTRVRRTSGKLTIEAVTAAAAREEVATWPLGRIDEAVRAQGVWMVEGDDTHARYAESARD